ncbi:MAG: ion transporter [Beijerinckiaceae bacterium]
MMESLRRIVSHPLTERITIALIIVNAITLGLETVKPVMDRFSDTLHIIDTIILWIFVAEISARIIVNRLAFFKDPWSLFDFFVIGIALVPATESLSVLRALRILRVLRLVTVVPSLRKVVAGLVGALPGMGSIVGLLFLVYYVFAVMATKLYSETNPDLFGHLGTTAYTLFQAMTFDDWSNGIVKPLAEKGHTNAWFFIMTFMVVSAFMVLNLFIGVVVTALDEVTSDGKPKVADEGPYDAQIVAELKALRTEVAALRERKAS